MNTSFFARQLPHRDYVYAWGALPHPIHLILCPARLSFYEDEEWRTVYL